MSSLAVTALIATVLVALAMTWWSPPEPEPSARAEALAEPVPANPAPVMSAAAALGRPLGPAEVSARVRLVQRLGRRGRLNQANLEARALVVRNPGFSARRWVNEAYEGVRREDEREADIRLLVSLGLPE